MLYQAYQAHADIMVPVRAFAGMVADRGRVRLNGAARPSLLSNLTAAYELIARARLTHERPAYGIAGVTVANREVAVTEEAADRTPFGTLLHFKKAIDLVQPRVLLIAPLSGHFATLLRATVRTMLAEHDVFITDWHNARDVGTGHGRFGFDDYVAHLIRFLEVIGPGAHIVAVCQPCVAALVAASVMAQGDSPAQPRSMTLMAGPIDTRISPTKVNELAKSKSIDWFERKLIARVPGRYAGGGRKVYPGFVQLAAFMSMNIERHVKAHRELYEHLAKADEAKAAVTKAFYDEYFAVLDLPPNFIWKPCGWCSRSTRCRSAGSPIKTAGWSRPPSIAPCCSRWRARRTISARSGRRWPRTISACPCGPTASATTCRPASAITAFSADAPGGTRSIPW
jgi:poly(3-hydroxybutyrate) depolymerase